MKSSYQLIAALHSSLNFCRSGSALIRYNQVHSDIEIDQLRTGVIVLFLVPRLSGINEVNTECEKREVEKMRSSYFCGKKI